MFSNPGFSWKVINFFKAGLFMNLGCECICWFRCFLYVTNWFFCLIMKDDRFSFIERKCALNSLFVIWIFESSSF